MFLKKKLIQLGILKEEPINSYLGTGETKLCSDVPTIQMLKNVDDTLRDMIRSSMSIVDRDIGRRLDAYGKAIQDLDKQLQLLAKATGFEIRHIPDRPAEYKVYNIADKIIPYRKRKPKEES